jgi:hypothetical protein
MAVSHSFHNTVTGCSRSLNPNYKPRGPDEKALFDENQKIIYAILVGLN